MSPLFHRKSEEEKEAERAERAEREQAAQRASEMAAASLKRIEEGRIPLGAAERLGQYAPEDGQRRFSSDLSINEWSSLAGLGVIPITQVMGSSIYHVGWQPTYYNVPTEVRVLSDAYNHCRRLAFNRLREEAQIAGADAVLGVRIDQGMHDWAPGAIEFIVLGTAVRLPEGMRDPSGKAVLSDLTGQAFTQLCKAGTRPVGIAAHASVHYVPATEQTQLAQRAWGASWVNQELVDFTQGVYEAREKAMSFVTAQARELGGDGVIGVSISQSSRTHEVRRGMYESTDLEVSFNLIGTVIREDPSLAQTSASASPLSIMSLS